MKEENLPHRSNALSGPSSISSWIYGLTVDLRVDQPPQATYGKLVALEIWPVNDDIGSATGSVV
jgi:hypothetical protein